jgi:hypothetical protein
MREKLVSNLYYALQHSWSKQSSSYWTKNNPALGQCGVTALVVNDYLGGEILKTKLKEGWHFYNCIDAQVIDFTEEQFISPPVYLNFPSSREEAYQNTNLFQYSALKTAVAEILANLQIY